MSKISRSCMPYDDAMDLELARQHADRLEKAHEEKTIAKGAQEARIADLEYALRYECSQMTKNRGLIRLVTWELGIERDVLEEIEASDLARARSMVRCAERFRNLGARTVDESVRSECLKHEAALKLRAQWIQMERPLRARDMDVCIRLPSPPSRHFKHFQPFPTSSLQLTEDSLCT